MTKRRSRRYKTPKWLAPVRPDDFHLERRMAGLSLQEAAAFLGVTPRAVRYWEAGAVRIPHAAYKLLRLRAGGIVQAEGWEGWRFGRGGALFSPDGRAFQAWELYNLRFVFSMSHSFRQMLAARRAPAPVAAGLGVGVGVGQACRPTPGVPSLRVVGGQS